MSDEINRYIHEEILGKCWHEGRGYTLICAKCKASMPDYRRFGGPDYCSDDSPRALLNEVVAKLREIQGTPFPFLDALDGLESDWTVATAEQVARACVVAHRASVESSATPSDATETP